MTTTQHIHGRIGSRREEFDRNMDFVAVRTFKASGKETEAGKIFDKSLVNWRRLRQLYEQRFLKQVEPRKSNEFTVPDKPDFTALSDEGLKQWLRNNKKIPRPRSTRAKLLEMIDVTWQEIIDGLVAANRAGKHSGERVPGPADDGDPVPSNRVIGG